MDFNFNRYFYLKNNLLKILIILLNILTKTAIANTLEQIPIKLINVDLGRCLIANREAELNTNSSKIYENIHEDFCNDQQYNQFWKLHYKGNGKYLIINHQSGKCLDASRTNDFEHNPNHIYGNIYEWPCHGAPNQLWILKEKGPGFQIINSESLNCMDTSREDNFSTNKNLRIGNIFENNCHDEWKQVWRICFDSSCMEPKQRNCGNGTSLNFHQPQTNNCIEKNKNFILKSNNEIKLIKDKENEKKSELDLLTREYDLIENDYKHYSRELLNSKKLLENYRQKLILINNSLSSVDDLLSFLETYQIFFTNNIEHSILVLKEVILKDQQSIKILYDEIQKKLMIYPSTNESNNDIVSMKFQLKILKDLIKISNLAQEKYPNLNQSEANSLYIQDLLNHRTTTPHPIHYGRASFILVLLQLKDIHENKFYDKTNSLLTKLLEETEKLFYDFSGEISLLEKSYNNQFETTQNMKSNLDTRFIRIETLKKEVKELQFSIKSINATEIIFKMSERLCSVVNSYCASLDNRHIRDRY